jgi:hypothetical protein
VDEAIDHRELHILQRIFVLETVLGWVENPNLRQPGMNIPGDVTQGIGPELAGGGKQHRDVPISEIETILPKSQTLEKEVMSGPGIQGQGGSRSSGGRKKGRKNEGKNPVEQPILHVTFMLANPSAIVRLRTAGQPALAGEFRAGRGRKSRAAAGGALFGEVEQRLARELGDAGIRMPEEGDEGSNPAQLGRFDADHRNGFIHSEGSLFSFRPQPSEAECIQGIRRGTDKRSVSAFLKHAEEILETARQNRTEDCWFAILVSRDGRIQILASPDGELEPLRIHYGAEAAYRITRRAGAVQLEGRREGETCILRAGPTEWPRRLCPEFPQYQLA